MTAKKTKKLSWEDNVTLIPPYARDRLNTILEEAFARHLTPAPNLNVAEWCAANRIIADVASPEPGPYRWQRAPYQYEMLKVAGDPKVSRLVLMMAIQTGKTIVLENIIAYYMANDGSPTMVVMPTKATAERWSETKLQPMIDATPCLHDLVRPSRERDSLNKKRFKAFPGGFVILASARAGTELVSIPVRILLLDEVDKYPPALDDGDPIELARGRTTNWWNRKEIMVSSPTDEETSRIYKEFVESDQRYYYVACPQCNQYQIIRWKNIKWTNDDPMTAHFVCGYTKTNIKDAKWRKENRSLKGVLKKNIKECGKPSQEHQKGKMLASGKWIAHAPKNDTPGFHLAAMYSPWFKWSDIVDQWLRIKTPFQRKAFVNTRLAEPWADYANNVEAHELEARVEQYDADSTVTNSVGQTILVHGCPTGVGTIVVGIDPQKDSIGIAAWGVGEMSHLWHIHSRRFAGMTTQDKVWNDLGHYIKNASFPTKRGAEVVPSVWAIDVGGHWQSQVYRFVRDMQAQGINIIPVRGSSNSSAPPIPPAPTMVRDYNLSLYFIGVSQLKDMLVPMLKNDDKDIPGYVHFRAGTPTSFFDELTAEKRHIKVHPKTGAPIREWMNYGQKPNHELDMYIYAYWCYLYEFERNNIDIAKLVEAVNKADPTEKKKEVEGEVVEEANTMELPPPDFDQQPDSPLVESPFGESYYNAFNIDY